jgi:TolA-binding protein
VDADSRPAEAAAVQLGETDDGLAGEREHPRRPPRISHRDTASVTSAPATAASEEIIALDQAIGLLRRRHDPGAALVALDSYLDRFPGGVLSREACFARVDALLKLDRSNEALAALEDLPLDTHGRSIELQVIRGELRSRSECVRAEQDFSAVLTRGANLALVERALYGRGACRIKRGDKTGSIQDLRDYLDRFPTGTHAVWARQWLDSANRSLANDGQVGRSPGH